MTIVRDRSHNVHNAVQSLKFRGIFHSVVIKLSDDTAPKNTKTKHKSKGIFLLLLVLVSTTIFFPFILFLYMKLFLWMHLINRTFVTPFFGLLLLSSSIYVWNSWTICLLRFFLLPATLKFLKCENVRLVVFLKGKKTTHKFLHIHTLTENKRAEPRVEYNNKNKKIKWKKTHTHSITQKTSLAVLQLKVDTIKHCTENIHENLCALCFYTLMRQLFKHTSTFTLTLIALHTFGCCFYNSFAAFALMNFSQKFSCVRVFIWCVCGRLVRSHFFLAGIFYILIERVFKRKVHTHLKCKSDSSIRLNWLVFLQFAQSFCCDAGFQAGELAAMCDKQKQKKPRKKEN